MVQFMHILPYGALYEVISYCARKMYDIVLKTRNQVRLMPNKDIRICIGNRMNASAFRDLWARVMF